MMLRVKLPIPFLPALVLVMICAAVKPAMTQSPSTNRVWRYQLIEGSALIDDCPICGRPTILQPMRGAFDLALLEQNPLFSRYVLRDISFTAGSSSNVFYRVAGQGDYQFGGEVALQQTMSLMVKINDEPTNGVYTLTNEDKSVQALWPMIDCTVRLRVSFTKDYTLRVVAAPLREIWFSTANGSSSGNTNSPGPFTSGDFLSSAGRLVKSQDDLIARLGLMPGVRGNYGLDAVDILPGGEVYFSLNQDVFSETLGQLRHGDLLSDRGRIVYHNQELLAAFGVKTNAPDAGLDAVAVQGDGEVLFSIKTDVESGKPGVVLLHGDILSHRGRVFKTNQQLLSRFHPRVVDHDYGLDSLYLWPSGEIWFSTEEGFDDQGLGVIRAGDLLSDQGQIVFRNLELVSAFAPVEDLADFGLDALFVVTDAAMPAQAPRFTVSKVDQPKLSANLQWNGEGRVFQLEKATDVVGPYLPITPIMPDTNFTDSAAVTNNSKSFYRVRQW